MNIDEAIEHAREVSTEQKRRAGICVQNDNECDKFSGCLNCAKEHEQLADWLEQLKEYQQLEEQGRLVKLPCKVGDWIFIVKRYGVEEANITGISEADDISCFCFKVYIDPDCEEIVALEDFNETWFLTKSEAEAKLKELRGDV